jgi:Protein of unknown function (DUF1579)
MKRKLIAGIALLSLLGTIAHAADEQQQPAADVPELQPLSHYAGNWEMELTIKSVALPQGAKTTGSSVGEWIHGGRYLRQSWTVNAADGVPEFSGFSIRTYDPRRQSYRTWGFDSAGNTEESQGTWDPKARTFTWTVRENIGGGETVTTSNFSEDGTEIWTILMKDGDGQVLADVSGKGTREKE